VKADYGQAEGFATLSGPSRHDKLARIKQQCYLVSGRLEARHLLEEIQYAGGSYRLILLGVSGSCSQLTFVETVDLDEG
jgi:hypothetical protein